MQPPLPKSALVCYLMPEKGLSTKYPQGIKLPSPVKVPLSMNLLCWFTGFPHKAPIPASIA